MYRKLAEWKAEYFPGRLHASEVANSRIVLKELHFALFQPLPYMR